MGYKVYAGTMKTTNPGYFYVTDPVTSVLVGYPYEIVSKNLVYSSDIHDTSENVILNPELTLTSGELGNFTFIVPHFLLDPGNSDKTQTNPFYNSIEIKKTKIMIEEDDTMIFVGYVKEIELDFNLNQVVLVEDILGMMDTGCAYIPPMKYPAWSKTDEGSGTLFRHILGQGGYDTDNRECSGPGFRCVQCTVNPDQEYDRTKEGLYIDTPWNALKSLFLDVDGAYLRCRYIPETHTDLDGTTRKLLGFAIDYLSDIDDKTEQTVSFGQNLLDFQYTEAVTDDLVNYITCRRDIVETHTSGWWIFASTTTDTKVIFGSAENQESIQKYGRVYRKITNDTANTVDEMNKVCEEALKQYKQFIEPTIMVKAFDLADTGVATDHLGFLKKTRIISEPHNIDEWMVCTKAVLPLDKPDQKEFTYGRPPEKLTDQQAKNTAQGSHHDLSIRGLIRAANG